MHPKPLLNDLDKLKWVTQAFANSHNGVFLTDGEGRILEVNPAFTIITGYKPDEIIGQSPKLIKSEVHTADFYDDLRRILSERGSWQGKISHRRKDGSIVDELLAIHAIYDDAGVIKYFLGSNIELAPFQADLGPGQMASSHDSLTRLPNRTLLTDRIRQTIAWMQRQGTLVALCCLDIVGFQSINTGHGYAMGDTVLAEVAARLKSSIREGDTVARLEGDKFAILLSDVDSMQEVDLILERISALLAAPIVQLDGQCLATRIGLSIYPMDSSSPAQLLDHAELAHGRIKQQPAREEGKPYSLFDLDQA